MPKFLSNWNTKIGAKIGEWWKEGNLPQKILIIGVIFSLTLIFILLLYWLNKEEYAILYSKLKQEDSAAVVQFLKQ